MNELHLFAGAGGGILGGILLGHTTVCAVEIEPYCRKVLLQRQRDGILPRFPIWDDVRTFDGKPWRGKVDVVCGGFPCQDISRGGFGEGITGERSGLWKDQARIISEVEPSFALVENSPILTSRGLGVVLGDLAEMGYDAEWGVLGAGHIGAWHLRERIWLVASNSRKERVQRKHNKKVYRESGVPWDKDVRGVKDLQDRPGIPDALLRRVRNGMADYVDRISAIGNGQVPAVVKLAWETLTGDYTKPKGAK
jgi:DNA (cytosine-5)-methyltransferase 1